MTINFGIIDIYNQATLMPRIIKIDFIKNTRINFSRNTGEAIPKCLAYLNNTLMER